MEKQWITATELAGIAGLPKSTAGIHGKARREGWERRRKRGVQGKAVEYAVESLPLGVLNVLRLRESPAEYVLQRQEPLTVWIEAYHQLTDAERVQAIAFLLREGVGALMKRLI
ncbi:DNA-binding protein [Yersinia pekkanenii]|uniref:MuA-transposase/repressor protein CI DNA-binding n=1 Tax=Yersinia pekkanenii TaxID=1288385 RepID=A0A0T9PZS6_9GAMM|nr:DNA-binding protein [Yersinia pekkanenii]CNH89374.1 MuA-transposase/repressor protein CI DNA-binding [Yersinia pekkanenii]CRY67804.1 MuA-transposase/repressor protein CI DNA-binding [Yersinia pekkanenii]